MGVKDKQTYGEYYWAMQIEADRAIKEAEEKALAPIAARLIHDMIDYEDLPPSVISLYNSLIEPTGQESAAVLGRFASEVADAGISSALEPTLIGIKQAVFRKQQGTLLVPAMAAILNQRNRIEDFEWDRYLQSAGYDDSMAAKYLEASLPYPSIPDIIRWARYIGDYDNPEPTALSRHYIDPRDFELWDWTTWEKLTTIQCQSLLKRGGMSEPEFYDEIGRIGWHKATREDVKDLSYILPNSMLLIQGGLIQGISSEHILENISKGDIHPDYAQTYLDAVLTKPASIDMVAYQLRKDPTLSVLESELKKIGIHPDYTKIYKELAYQIPPVADIITMAVREAFTPEIAAKFGQYQDFPADLEKYAGQKGLDAEWAKRYWAAHWALPSPQQGFEMLHRGVIDRSELDMLLRASDVMPFWREKLTAIAYRTLTRVDVRRMYKEGVLSEREVFEAYQDHGYSDENAERMAEFTVKQTLSSLSKFTSSDIIKAFTNRMIDRGTATSMLRDIGIRAKDANYIISTAEYKRLWAFTDDQIAGIRNLYKKRIYNEDQTRDRLAGLNLPAEQITVLMQRWFYDKVEELDATWTTAQTLKFLKRRLITTDRAKQELYLNGFTEERINVYLKDAQWTPPKE